MKWRILDENLLPIDDPSSFDSLTSYRVSCDTQNYENTDAIETLKKRGIEITVPPKSVSAQFEGTGQKARRLLVGKLFPQAFLDDVEGALVTYRREHKATK